MRLLRYWLGLPLLNLILILLLCVFPATLPSETICGGLFTTITIYTFVVLFRYAGLIVLPLLTALYYPVERWDCRPLWVPAVVSFIMLAAMWYAVMLIFGFNGAGLLGAMAVLPMALAVAAVETIGYSVGLLIAKTIANAKQKRHAIK